MEYYLVETCVMIKMAYNNMEESKFKKKEYMLFHEYKILENAN